MWVRSVSGPLGSLVKHSDNMIGRKKTSESDVKQELLSCMRPLLFTYAAITPPWATHSFTICIDSGVSLPAGYATMVRKIEKSGLA
jgi:hypothetical protein